ncbi:hypothetical protein HORIV_25560 [Vreelandella olivaria]|uniref:Uncharacterized protein n=1 Tax=Vreelandella olivaria TaxID=390919 RepID=A0ABM7GI04_9GAMM|nr:hypothetical protein HORIV_25560 [Halomonas olivaria]
MIKPTGKCSRGLIFKGVDASFTLEGDKVQLEAEVDFQLKQMLDVLRARLIARGSMPAVWIFKTRYSPA